MIIDGRALAERIYQDLEARFAEERPALGILLAAGDAATESFVRIKTRAAQRLFIPLERIDLPERATTEEAIAAVAALARRCMGVVVQLPLPQALDTDAVLAAIPRERDADALNPQVPERERVAMAPVARAVLAILDDAGVVPGGKRAVVIGDGRLVGAPCSAALRAAGAAVEVVTLEQGSLASLASADIVVAGAGSPGLITPAMLMPGCVLIDAGTSESGGKVVGDADPRCADVASVFTPVPGGVGPVAVAMLFANLADLARRAL
ncbi:MAG TPA: bifunctional 5,10-methylenetetrahydrofolate dehydrogenase/5,10-methenyltetrahydrofolate cyclohydrolase [Candidatus Paceibacterota bacterium]|nr:bifunctional 5,10-methylenetetrahydrofolate dehydrogenase/5,10-methenyltetrahydrofolate cyclohydrolase [Candidatus Paceibacterota bacterium]